ncbi:hypothetical protein TNCV_568741 [Trichonephila clavipes]|nr:hypothetical protein TNCV_568741 [Trichonephila clavipes]
MCLPLVRKLGVKITSAMGIAYIRDGEPLARVPLMARGTIFWARHRSKRSIAIDSSVKEFSVRFSLSSKNYQKRPSLLCLLIKILLRHHLHKPVTASGLKLSFWSSGGLRNRRSRVLSSRYAAKSNLLIYHGAIYQQKEEPKPRQTHLMQQTRRQTYLTQFIQQTTTTHILQQLYRSFTYPPTDWWGSV